MKRLVCWIPFLLFFISLVVRLTAVYITQFDGLYGQDSFAYYDYALELKQALFAGESIPSFSWPIGYPLLVIIATFFVGTQAWAGQIASIITSALVAPVIYWLIRELEPKALMGAVIAALLSATAAQFLISSLSVMSDVAGLLWATISALMLIRFVKSDWHWGWLVAAVVALALAILTRWVYGLLILPWAVGGLFAAREQQKSWRDVAITAVISLTIGLIIIGSQFWRELPQGEFSHAVDLEVVTWSPLNAFKTTIENTDGAFEYERPTALYYLLPTLHPAYIFPLLTPFLLIGFWAMRSRSLSQKTIVIGWFLIIYIFLAGIAWQNWRFPLALFSPLLVLVGVGVDWVWRQRPSWHKVILTLCLFTLLGSLAWAGRDLTNFANWKQAQLTTIAWLDDQLPADSYLITFGLTFTIRHYMDITSKDLTALDEASLAELIQQNDKLYLFIDPENVHSQWQDKQQGINVRWLEEHADLLHIGRSDDFVLYWVQPKQPVAVGTTPLLVAPDK